MSGLSSLLGIVYGEVEPDERPPGAGAAPVPGEQPDPALDGAGDHPLAPTEGIAGADSGAATPAPEAPPPDPVVPVPARAPVPVALTWTRGDDDVLPHAGTRRRAPWRRHRTSLA